MSLEVRVRPIRSALLLKSSMPSQSQLRTTSNRDPSHILMPIRLLSKPNGKMLLAQELRLVSSARAQERHNVMATGIHRILQRRIPSLRFERDIGPMLHEQHGCLFLPQTSCQM